MRNSLKIVTNYHEIPCGFPFQFLVSIILGQIVRDFTQILAFLTTKKPFKVRANVTIFWNSNPFHGKVTNFAQNNNEWCERVLIIVVIFLKIWYVCYTGSQNSSHSSLDWYGFDVDSELQASLTAMYSVTFTTALLGNILLIHIIRLHRPLNSVSILIANMAASDLLTALFAMPYSTAYLYVQHGWFGGIMGSITCKLINFVIGTTIAVSIFALLTISVERYIAVVKPLSYSTFIKRPILLSTAIWFSAVIFMSVFLYVHDVEMGSDGAQCSMNWEPLFSNEVSPKVFYATIAIVLYVLPLLSIAVLSALIIRKLNKTTASLDGNHLAEHVTSTARKRNHRVMRMLLAVITLFAVCWLPVHVLHILIYFFGDIYISLPPSVALLLYWVSHANSALNPCVIILLNGSFRKSFTTILHSLSPKNHRVNHINRRSFCFVDRTHGCLPRKATNKYSVRWNRREPIPPVTILDIKLERSITNWDL